MCALFLPWNKIYKLVSWLCSMSKGVLLGWLTPAVERERPLVKQMRQKRWENYGRYLLERGQKIPMLNVILRFIPNQS